MGVYADEDDTFLNLYATDHFNLYLARRFRSGLDADAFT